PTGTRTTGSARRPTRGVTILRCRARGPPTSTPSRRRGGSRTTARCNSRSALPGPSRCSKVLPLEGVVLLRHIPRIPCLLVGLASAVGARPTSASSTSAPPSSGDQQIAGKQLVLKDSPAEAKRRLSTLSNDRRITLGGGNGSADDPTLFGGSLRVRTATGD